MRCGDASVLSSNVVRGIVKLSDELVGVDLVLSVHHVHDIGSIGTWSAYMSCKSCHCVCSMYVKCRGRGSIGRLVRIKLASALFLYLIRCFLYRTPLFRDELSKLDPSAWFPV